MSNASFINLYENQAGYNAETHGVNGSEVSLIEEANKVVYDGVNVELPEGVVPSVGTSLWVDDNGGKHFYEGSSVDAAKLTAQGLTFVGVVALSKGRKATVLHKTENASIRFTSCWAWEITGITYGSSNTIQFQQRKKTGSNPDTFGNVDIGSALVFTPTDIDDAVSQIDAHLKTFGNEGGKSYDSDIVANYNWHCEKLDGRIWVIADFDSSPSYRQYEGQVVKNTNIANGPISSTNMWTLAGMSTNYNSITRNDGVGSNYYAIWNKDVVKAKNTNQGSPADQVGHDGYYNEENFNNTTALKAYYGTYDNYLNALLPKYPVNDRAMAAYAGKGAETCATAERVVYTKRDGVTTEYMFSAIHYTNTLKAHSTASVDGMNAGDWYMPGLDEIVEIFSQMKVDGSDPIHQAFANAGQSSAYPVNPSSNVYRWVPARFDSSTTWLLYPAGTIDYNYFSANLRACGVALLNL